MSSIIFVYKFVGNQFSNPQDPYFCYSYSCRERTSHLTTVRYMQQRIEMPRASSNRSSDVQDAGPSALFVVGVVFLWYGTSCVATTSSKVLLRSHIVESDELLLLQFFMTAVYLKLFEMLGVFRFNYSLEALPAIKFEVALMSMTYLFGFFTLQLGLRLVSVSFAVTMRGFEPVTTCFLSSIFLSEKLHVLQWLAIALIVTGASLCAGSDLSWTYHGLLVLFICDMCFSLRSLSVKLIRKKCVQFGQPKMTGPTIFFLTSVIGTTILIALKCFYVLTGDGGSVTDRISDISAADWKYLFVSSICFTLYNTSSYIFLGMFETHVHAVSNAIRQIIVIIYSIWLFSLPVHIYKWLGFFLL